MSAGFGDCQVAVPVGIDGICIACLFQDLFKPSDFLNVFGDSLC